MTTSRYINPRQLTEAQAERIVQTDPEFGSAFLTMDLSELQARIAAGDDPITGIWHPSLRRKAIAIFAARMEGK